MKTKDLFSLKPLRALAFSLIGLSLTGLFPTQGIGAGTGTGGKSIQNQPAWAQLETGGVLLHHRQTPAGPKLQLIATGPDGAAQGPPRNLEVGPGWALNPALTARPGGDYLAAWQQTVDGVFQVFAAPLSATGELAQSPVRLSFDAGPAYDPNVASRSDGSLVVWFDLSSGTPTIHAQKLNPAGLPEGSVKHLSDGLTAAHYPAVSPTPQGFLVVWHQLHENSPRIFSLALSAAGEPLGSPRLADGDSAASYYPSLSASDDEAAVAFHTLGKRGWEIRLQPLTHLGLPHGEGVTMSANPNATYASLAFDGEAFQVAWMERSRSESRTFFNRLNPETRLAETPQALSGSGYSTFPLLSMGGNGLLALTVNLDGQQESLSQHRFENQSRRWEVLP